MKSSKVEFHSFAIEIKSVDRHQKDSDDTRETEGGRKSRRFRREHKSPEDQERAEQRADRDEDYMETA